MTDGPIAFSSRVSEYAWVSNFHPTTIVIDANEWLSVEHYFQAQKFTDQAMRSRIANATNAQTAKALGRSRKSPIRQDWDTARLAIMRMAIAAKFDQHADLAAKLVATAPRRLIEANPHDAFWARVLMAAAITTLAYF